MMPRLALRGMAVAIAVAGLFDPVLTLSRPALPPLAITILDSPGSAAYETAGRLASALADRFAVSIHSQPRAADASPCPPAGACVVISDGAGPRRLAAGGPLGGVRVKATRTASVAIRDVSAPLTNDPDARGVLEVALETGIESPLVRVFDDDVLVGQATGSRVEWTPVAAGLRVLRVATADDEIHAAVEVAPERYEVLFYEPQPAWMATFVRRALERDPRFVVRGRARIANAVTVATAGAALDIQSLEQTAVRVVIVSAPEQLTATEAATLTRFMSNRGGSVVALVDGATGAAAPLLAPFTMNERREPQAIAIGPLKAAELVAFGPLDAATTPLLSAASAAIVVSRAVGNGRLVASGAGDAWRYRDDSGFAAFWQSLVADAAVAAGEPITLTLPRLLRPRERVPIAVEWRPVRDAGSTFEARAALVCGNETSPVRLWPDGVPGRFEGEFVAPAGGECRVTASVNSVTASAAFVIRDVRTPPARGTADLATAIAAHGGMVVDGGNEAALATALRRSAARADARIRMHPMRSPWWLVPFAACLGGEWWLRRRRGLL